MKKVLFVALAAVGLTACVANESVKMADTDAISFSTYINTPSRTANPTTTTDNIQNFDVWAFMDEYTGTVLVDEDVTKSSSGWGYSNIQYWTPNHTYYFAALSPMNTANITSKTLATGDDAKLGLGEIAYSNPAGTEDLLYTVAMAQTPDFATLTANGMLPVSLQFKHLLSKVKFTFKNSFRTDNVTIKVTDVEMKVAETASINLAAADYSKNWVNLAGETTLDFGDVDVLSIGQSAATENERLTIPALATDAKAVYNITFKVEVYNGDVLAHIYDKEATISGYELVMGKAYNFTAEITPATLGLEPIEFTVTVKPWDQEIVTPVGTYVSSIAELEEAVNNATADVVVCLGTDLAGTATLVQKAGVDVVVDGCGHKYDGVILIDGQSRHNGEETLTIRGVNFETASTEKFTFIEAPKKNAANVYNYAHNVTIENCTFKGTWAQDGDVETGCASFTQSYHIKMVNCTATNVHSGLQVASHDNDVLVDGLTVVDSKNGVSFGNAASAVIRNSNIDAYGYGIRANGNDSRGALVVENTTVAAAQPIVVRKMTTTYKVTLGDGVVLNRTAGDYDVVFTKDDDGSQVTPTGTYNYSSVNSFNVFPGYQVADSTYTVINGPGLLEVVTTVLADSTQNVTIELGANIDLAGIAWPAVCAKAAFVLDGKGYAIKNLTTSAVEDHGFYSTAMFTSTRKAATIKNLVVENATVTGRGGDNSHGAVLVACNYGALTISGVTVKNSTVSNCDRSAIVATYLYFVDAKVENCVVEGCTVDSIGTAGAVLGMNNSHNLEMNNCSVVDTTISSSEGSNKAGIFIGTWQNAGTLTESGNTHSNAKAINAGTETNNVIGRRV